MTKDRTGEDIDPEAHAGCTGWVDYEADNPRPCLICKPHLNPDRLGRALLDADQIRATRPPEGEAT